MRLNPAVVATALSSCSGLGLPRSPAEDPLPEAAPQGIAATLRYRAGPTSGSLQTGQGGKPGTSSPGRPTLEEIGVDRGEEVGAEIGLVRGHHEWRVDASALLLDGEAVLEEDLISHGETFPAGTRVDSSSWFGFWSLAYRYRFELAVGAANQLFVKPGGGLTGFTYDYELEGDNGAFASRGYSHGAPHVELELQWRPAPHRWYLTADVRQTLGWATGGSQRVDLFEGLVGAHYTLLRSWELQLEGGYRHLQFEDEQTLPNDLDVRFGPFAGVVLSWRH